jgi:hypothetical protein
MADAPQDQAPSDLETKDTNRLKEYRTAPVPHVNRTGSELTEEERAAADAPNQGIGITTQVGGATSAPAVGGKPAGKPAAGKQQS